MNIKFLTLSIITVAASVGTSMTPAQAQGARFQYEPNVWGSEVHARRAASRVNPVAPHSVMHGSTPRSSNFLTGANPGLFSKPAPVVAAKPILVPESVVVARPMIKPAPQVPVIAQQQQLMPFNNAFGKPVSPTQQPLAATPAAASMPASKPQPTSHRPTHRVRQNLSGKLLPRKQAVPAVATPQIANYGGQFYAAGSGVNGVGQHSTATVSGTVIKRK